MNYMAATRINRSQESQELKLGRFTDKSGVEHRVRIYDSFDLAYNVPLGFNKGPIYVPLNFIYPIKNKETENYRNSVQPFTGLTYIGNREEIKFFINGVPVAEKDRMIRENQDVQKRKTETKIPVIELRSFTKSLKKLNTEIDRRRPYKITADLFDDVNGTVNANLHIVELEHPVQVNDSRQRILNAFNRRYD